MNPKLNPTIDIDRFDFLSSRTREMTTAHNHDAERLLAQEAETARLVEQIEAHDPNADVCEMFDGVDEVKRRKRADARLRIEVLKAAIECLHAIQAERLAALRDATWKLDATRTKIIEELRRIGFGGWIEHDRATGGQLSQVVDWSDPVQAAVRRVQELQDSANNMDVGMMQAEANMLRERLRSELRAAAKAVA